MNVKIGFNVVIVYSDKNKRQTYHHLNNHEIFHYVLAKTKGLK